MKIKIIIAGTALAAGLGIGAAGATGLPVFQLFPPAPTATAPRPGPELPVTILIAPSARPTGLRAADRSPAFGR
jgi:hypothetical protein